jgi:DNA primase
VDANILAERLRGSVDDIILILKALGHNEDEIVSHNNDQYLSTRRLGNHDNRNGVIVYTDSLRVMMPTIGKHTDLIGYVMDVKGYNFPQTLNFMARVIKFENNFKITYPFGGFYKRVHKDIYGIYEDLGFTHYSEDQLPPKNQLSYKYLKDGVDLLCQEYFGVRFSLCSNSIWMPIYDYSGELVGCKARSNDPNCPYDSRFYAPLPYPKTHVLYGYDKHYKNIVEHSTCIIFESEKSVMQAHSFNCNLGLAIGGHNISQTQAHYIKSLGCKNVIVAFDESISDEESAYEASKLKVNNAIIKNNVYFLNDKYNQYLPKDSKDSPVDHGQRIFKELLKRCRFKV